MGFDLLVSRFRAAEAALAISVRDGHRADQSAARLKLCADLLDQLERYEPVTRAERRDKAFFFLRRGLSNVRIPGLGRDIDIALALGSGPDGVEREDRPSLAFTGDRSIDGLISYVRNAAMRVSLIDATHRYVAVSEPNAAFYETRSVRMVGLHVSEIIGRDRFEGRARGRLDACLAGEPQEYYHGHDPGAPDAAHGAHRVFRCDMAPVEVPGHGRFALVYMTDVTDIVRNGIRPEPEIPARAADGP